MTDNLTLDAIAVRLATTADEALHAVRPIDRRLANANLEGQTQVLALYGWGMTPASVYLNAIEAVRAAGPMPPATADNIPRKRWLVAVAADIRNRCQVWMAATSA